MKPWIALLFLLLSPTLAQTQTAPKDCSYFHENLQAIHFYRQFFSPSTCYLNINPFETAGLVYRSFLFSEQGLLMVFNSYGESENSTSTGARVFYLLPRNQNPDRIVRDGNLVVKTATTGTEFEINGLSGRLQGLSTAMGPAQITEADVISKFNKGGVEIRKYPGLMLDAGFTLGKDPTTDPLRKTLITGKNGKTCQLMNKEIFTYDSSGSASLAFSDQDLKLYLQAHCPGLDPGY